MRKAIKLLKFEFDNLENHNCEVVTEVGIFVADGQLTAHGKVGRFIQSLDPEKRYLGWDGQVYPQYKLEHVTLS